MGQHLPAAGRRLNVSSAPIPAIRVMTIGRRKSTLTRH
jgi:hypothetical protein